MKKIRNAIAVNVNEKMTLQEYASFASATAVSRVGSAMSGFFGGLVASTFMGLSESAFATYSTIIFVLGFWDIANDVIVASFLDKNRRTFGSWGRFKPWLLMMIIPFNLVVIMQTFPLRDFFPGLSDTFKVIYLVSLYFLNDAFSTFYNAAMTALAARRTANNMERGYFAAIESIIGTAVGSCGTYIAALLPFIFPNATDAQRYFYSYSAITLIAVPLSLWHIVVTRERIAEPPKEVTPRLRDFYKDLINNKPLLMYMISDIIGQGFGIGYSLMTYAFIACFGAETFSLTLFEGTAIEFTYVYDSGNYAALLSVAALSSFVTTGISLFLAPILRKWIDDKFLFIGTRLGTGICYAGMFFSVYPFESHSLDQIFLRVVFWYALHGLTTGFYNTIPGLIQMATYDYAEYKFGERNEATVSSLKSTIGRIISNCTTYLTNLFLVYVGYKEFAETPELMPLKAKSTLLYMFAIFPSVFATLSIIPMLFYKLSGKKHKEIVDALEARRQNSLDNINKIEQENVISI